MTTPTEQTDERSLLAVSKSIAAKSCIIYSFVQRYKRILKDGKNEIINY
jgi:hypothetical protein